MADPLTEALLPAARRKFHASLFEQGLLGINAEGVPTIADTGSNPSKKISAELIGMLRVASSSSERLKGQTAGAGFETLVEVFLKETFGALKSVRPGLFQVSRNRRIEELAQYEHLASIAEATAKDPALLVALGSDYLIRPDVVVVRLPEGDELLNSESPVVDSTTGLYSPLRSTNLGKPTLHASISCKWTLRSDRAQNARSEALNLIRNRKGRLPHIAVITAEPMAGRIASLALGTGDIDCVYHIALRELIEASKAHGSKDVQNQMSLMVDGKRLRDISDLPLDLAI